MPGFWRGESVFFCYYFMLREEKKYLTCHFCLHLICSLKFPLLSSFYFHHDQSDIKHPLCCRSLKSKLHHVSFSCLFSPPCHSEVSIHWLSAHICSPSLFLNTSLLVYLFSFLFSPTKTPSPVMYQLQIATISCHSHTNPFSLSSRQTPIFANNHLV